jgi:Concanavalin A-like lectin/glucanases superfamily
MSASAPAPAHWWQAEGNANDSVGADNGRRVGAGFGPGVFGPDQAFRFAGGGQRVVFNKFGGNRRRGDFTFAFDIKTTATVEQAVWEKRVACDTDGTPFWGFRTNGRGVPAGSIDFEYGTPPPGYSAISTTPINDGKWHLVVATRHGVTVKLYIDGNLEATITTPTTQYLANNAPMRAGVSTCDGIDGTHPFTGKLDELMIFRSALSQTSRLRLTDRLLHAAG